MNIKELLNKMKQAMKDFFGYNEEQEEEDLSLDEIIEAEAKKGNVNPAELADLTSSSKKLEQHAKSYATKLEDGDKHHSSAFGKIEQNRGNNAVPSNGSTKVTPVRRDDDRDER